MENCPEMGQIHTQVPKVIGFTSNLTITCSKVSINILDLYSAYLPRFVKVNSARNY